MQDLLLLAKESAITYKQVSTSKVLVDAFAKAGIDIPTDLSLNVSDEHMKVHVLPTLEIEADASETTLGLLLQNNYSSMPDIQDRMAVMFALTEKNKNTALKNGVQSYSTVVCVKIIGTSVNGYVRTADGGGKGNPHILLADVCDTSGNSIPELTFMTTDQGHPVSVNFFGRFQAAEKNIYQRLSVDIQGKDGYKFFNKKGFSDSITKGGSLPTVGQQSIEITQHFDKYAVTVGGQKTLVVKRPVSKNIDVNFLPFEASSQEAISDMEELFIERKATSKVLRKSIALQASDNSLFELKKEAAVNDAKLQTAGKLAGFTAVQDANPNLSFAEQMELFKFMSM
jgi:hypothetical protein